MQAMARIENEEHPQNHRPPVIVGRFRDLTEAELAKGVLESAGIESFLADDNIVAVAWHYSNAVGGIKLFVRAENAETARELLQQYFPNHL